MPALTLPPWRPWPQAVAPRSLLAAQPTKPTQARPPTLTGSLDANYCGWTAPAADGNGGIASDVMSPATFAWG